MLMLYKLEKHQEQQMNNQKHYFNHNYKKRKKQNKKAKADQRQQKVVVAAEKPVSCKVVKEILSSSAWCKYTVNDIEVQTNITVYSYAHFCIHMLLSLPYTFYSSCVLCLFQPTCGFSLSLRDVGPSALQVCFLHRLFKNIYICVSLYIVYTLHGFSSSFFI